MLKNSKFWLLFSLCINLLLIGLIVGGSFRAREFRDTMILQNEIGLFLRIMNQEERRHFRENLNDGIRAHAPKLPIQELADWVGADPFDPEPIRRSFDMNRRHNDARARIAHEQILDYVGSLNREQREELAKRIRDLPQRRRHNPMPRRK